MLWRSEMPCHMCWRSEMPCHMYWRSEMPCHMCWRSKMPCHMIMARASLRQGDHGCHAMAPHCPPRVASVLLAGLGCAVLDLHSGSPTEVWSSTTGALPCGGRSEDSEDPTCRPSVLQRRFMFVISHPARATIRHCTLQGRIRPKRKLSACFEK